MDYENLLPSGLYRRPRSFTGSCVAAFYALDACGLYRRSGMSANTALSPCPEGHNNTVDGLPQTRLFSCLDYNLSSEGGQYDIRTIHFSPASSTIHSVAKWQGYQDSNYNIMEQNLFHLRLIFYVLLYFARLTNTFQPTILF